jgi:1-acyl-sn-glycerol-3-phosphate acyltransferase
VRVGKPLTFGPEYNAMPPAKARREVTEQVISAIQELTGQEYVHMYASDRKAELAEGGGGGGSGG